ncbi:hypothetical protein [uncultured Campylobacter sp.]|uniref:hypothetical protein n=1 Tax=uncultured Campylobacter sp. TaxID=218934 RepID=UPI0026122419|nr:hypothetical protein [uncultured Campylobacter sp.]
MTDEAMPVKRRKFNQLALQNFKAATQTTQFGERCNVFRNGIWRRADKRQGAILYTFANKHSDMSDLRSHQRLRRAEQPCPLKF